MKKKIFIISIFALLLSGCVQNEQARPEKHNSNQAPWSKQSSEDNIDISDLDGNITEKELGMSEQTSKLKRIAFPTSEYYPYSGVGKGTIKGNIYIENSSGQKVMGSETRLYLNPITSYSDQWYEKSYLGGNKMEEADSRLFNYLKFTASNTQGAFAFYGVPSGRYYLIGTVKCGTECGFSTVKSVRIATKVSVYGNNVVVQDLSKNSN